MKKIFFSLVLLFVGQVIYAQDLNKLMDNLAKVEGAQRQVMDKAMLSQSIPESQKDKMPDFMSKADSVVAVIVQNCPQDVNDKIQEGITGAETSGIYEPLVTVKKENNRVSILSGKGEDENKDVYICVAGGNAVVFVKLSGKFTIDDLANIVKEQQKDNDN
ncbi:hypothetical protein FACS1894179_02110 [Bacteroidia bacterium]|nr:hypothetical protein FACS1894169_08930 [Bacteroidia bacterium]GHV38548.1 hypothetical protein FACS1894179_02110 [Bacteroidia bacterium]